MIKKFTYSKDKERRVIHVAIPAMGESGWLPGTITSLADEKNSCLKLWVCVNQPDNWHDDPVKKPVCENNLQTLKYLSRLKGINPEVIDRSSPGRGWSGKAHGVGHARRLLMESINSVAGENDIILSLDADTAFDRNYTFSVLECLEKYPDATALSNPYYHKLTGNNELDRAILRYEIYMRYYSVNMWRISSPYSFTALGSAIALPVWSYRKIGGITPKKSGEDFYFLQKLRKSGWICNFNTHLVYPATRYSDRVFFGTGPALIKGSKGDWSSYPVYCHRLFDLVREGFDLFPLLYRTHATTKFIRFIPSTTGEDDPFGPLRKNSPSADHFLKACHQKADGLRTLQFLKSENKKLKSTDEERLLAFLASFCPWHKKENSGIYEKCGFQKSDLDKMESLDFKTTDTDYLNKIRNLLILFETGFQKEDIRWKC